MTPAGALIAVPASRPSRQRAKRLTLGGVLLFVAGLCLLVGPHVNNHAERAPSASHSARPGASLPAGGGVFELPHEPPPAAPVSAPAPSPRTSWAEMAGFLSAMGGLFSAIAGLTTALVGVVTLRRATKVTTRAHSATDRRRFARAAAVRARRIASGAARHCSRVRPRSANTASSTCSISVP